MTLSYGALGNNVAYTAQYRVVGTDDWQSGGTSTSSFIAVNGLQSGTTYEFRVRARGHGKRYRALDGPWTADSSLLSARTAGFSALIPAPPRDISCRVGSQTWRGHDEKLPLTAPDNSTHIARAEVRAVQLAIPSPDWCVEARFINKSSPGADGSSWGGKFYTTEAEVEIENMTGLTGLNYQGFLELYDPVQPNLSGSPARTVPTHTCAYPCQGGTLQSRDRLVTGRMFKVPTIFVYGTHNFTVGDDWNRPVNTFIELDLPATSTGNSVVDRQRQVDELRQDLLAELVDPVIEWIDERT